jgi:lambda family phage portal protein
MNKIVKRARNAALAVKPRVSGLAGGLSEPPYDAANIRDQHWAAWQPALYSPDVEINMYRDRIVSRVRDLVRNDGWAAGAVTRILDNAIGPNLRPISKPDHRFLKMVTGKKSFDSEWAKEYGSAVDSYWKSWSEDPGFYCDAQRSQSFAQLMRVAFRHKLIDGDALAQIVWLEGRVGYGLARYATAVQLIDPDRLSNPQQQFDQRWMRGGVNIDENGAAIGYWIRRAHWSDWYAGNLTVTWDLIPRQYPWGRAIIVHDFDGDRASQHRGGVGIFTPVLQRLKMLVKYDNAELDSAIINAIFAAYVESPFDHTLMQEALSDGENLNYYQEMRREFHEGNRMLVGNSRVPVLFPGEKINSIAATRPHSNFKDFENAVLRNVASGAGLSAQQVSNDWSDVNYSSARAALLEAWKTLMRRKHEFGTHFCNPIRCAWLEEAFVEDEIPLPAGAPDFNEYRAAYSRCRWLGPGRGWVDPLAEKQASVLGMQAGLTTLEREAAEFEGEDWEELVEQRAYEVKRFKELGLEPPDWTGEGAKKDQEAGNLPPKPQKPQPKDGGINGRSNVRTSDGLRVRG